VIARLKHEGLLLSINFLISYQGQSGENKAAHACTEAGDDAMMLDF
jgi:hypothetical protein